MSWYYAGPEAKPVGPVSLEELQARRVNGLIAADTYVIEQTGQPGVVGTWRRYQEVFPPAASLPPLPLTHPPALPPAPPAAHPLFPSAAAIPARLPVYPPNVLPHAAPHGHYPVHPMNACCAWGFGLGLAGFVLAFVCGIGLLLSAPALIICILGFAQVQQRRDQSGGGLAIAGGVLALIGLIISIAILAYVVPLAIKEQQLSLKTQNSE